VNRYVYLLKLAAVQIRSLDPDALILQGAIPVSATEWETLVFAQGTAPYVDGVAVMEPSEAQDDLASASMRRMVSLIEQEDPSGIIVAGVTLPENADAARKHLLGVVLRQLGTTIRMTFFGGEPKSLHEALAGAARVGDLLSGDLVTLDERSTNLRLLQGSSDVTSSLPHRLLYSPTTFDTYFLYWSPSGEPTVDIEINVAGNIAPMVRDPVTGSAQPPVQNQTNTQKGALHFTLPMSDDPRVLDFNFGGSDLYAERSEVRSEALPSVEEIIFRYQQTQAIQDAALRSYTASLRIEQHFHPSPADPPYNLVTENRLYWDRGVAEWEELTFEVNGAKWTANRPAFPLVQPEKVLSLPLDLRLNQDYRYRLDGVDVVAGRPAFVVRFEPADSALALYRGTVWIDRGTYVRLKVQAVETQLSGPVVSNDETQIFEPAGEINGREIWLLNRLASKQIFLIAGRNVLIEREVHFSDVALNLPNSRPSDPRRVRATGLCTATRMRVSGIW
jgi:hypothetical protein